jgi:uncharacterized membrane protein YadS
VTQTKKSAWWVQEDWLSVWLGSTILIAAIVGWKAPMAAYAWRGTDDLRQVFSGQNLLSAAALCGTLLALSLPGALAMKTSAIRYASGFCGVFCLSFLSQVLAGSKAAGKWGLEYVIFGLCVGLLISNTSGTPEWLREGVRTEYYIKTGLVILGATILFGELLQAGMKGMIQAVLVVTVVWWIAYRLSKRVRLSDEWAALLASAVAICGVSAAIATCGAIQGDRKKLSYVTSLVLIVAVPMMIAQPWIVKEFGIPDEVGGAWLGGTLDTTGSVVAAGSLISETAMKTGTIVKFSQNVLLGLAAFLLSVWWAMKGGEQARQRPSARVIWERFPKFVLGFMAASLVFSFLVPAGTVRELKSPLSGLRNVWFAMAFVSIGLETRFRDLVSMEGGRPAMAFVAAQAVNVVWTLLLAWLIFR